MARILIAVPTFETITPDTFKALWDMDKPCECDFEFVRGYDVATARNNIVKQALAGPYSHVMMVDSDVTPPKDALANLLSHREKVVIGYYAHRDKSNLYSGRTCACRLADANGVPYLSYPLESEYTADELREMRERGEYLVQIHGGGMGCIMIDVTVFFGWPYPWFDWVNYSDDDRSMLSEDLYFCEGCRNSDVPVYVDTRVSCGHLLRHIQTCG